MSSHLTNTSRTGCPIHRAVVSRDEWAFAKRTALLILATALTTAHAQNPCSLAGIKHSGTLAYPPIARQAHVMGDVDLLVVFDTKGTVKSIDITGGARFEELRKTAENYVGSWQVYATEQDQACPIEISFRIEGEESCEVDLSSRVRMLDTQHFVVSTTPTLLCDPSATITRTRHRFLFFHWYSKPITHINE
jgi:hypothetical protein